MELINKTRLFAEEFTNLFEDHLGNIDIENLTPRETTHIIGLSMSLILRVFYVCIDDDEEKDKKFDSCVRTASETVKAVKAFRLSNEKYKEIMEKIKND